MAQPLRKQAIAYVFSLLLVVSWIFYPGAALAASCYNAAGHRVCVSSIKRSAKHYWEYWATVSIDGVARPREVYNCRDRLWVQKNGKVRQFTAGDAGEIVCRLYRPPFSRSIPEALVESPEL